MPGLFSVGGFLLLGAVVMSSHIRRGGDVTPELFCSVERIMGGECKKKKLDDSFRQF
jgi:hypothetical protein